MRRVVSLWLCVLMVTALAAGCTPKAPPAGEGKPPAPPEESKMILATGGTAGTYYPLGGAMGQIWNTEIAGVNVTAQATGASVENLRLLDKKEVELALTQNDIAEYAAKGLEAFKDKPLTSARGIACLYPEVIQVIVMADSRVKSIKDAKGYKVSVGAPGSGNEANARQILNMFGITYDDIKPFYLSYAESAEQFKDGHIDVIMLTTGAPNAAIQDVATVKKIRVIPFSEEEISALRAKYPFFSKFTLPANTYQGQTTDIATVSVQAILVGHKDLSEDLVYRLTKVLWEEQAALAQANAKAKAMDLQDPVKAITIPIHPGAVKYYREKGITISK